MTPGSRLGPYEILSALGAGGMGEVFKARDTRLDRLVAIKVLSPALSGAADARERFEREAHAISRLSHPHICALFDVGTIDGRSFLVMELLNGETLAAVIARGPLPMPDVLRIGGAIAEALDAAHRQGIVHRDLKPGNVMITKAGVKLLDFGLAKTFETGDPRRNESDSPTVAALTARGTWLGTAPYMSPEQIDGRPTEGRSDIFALGAVLYEMATGTRAFAGQSSSAIAAAILHGEPAPISSSVPGAPMAFSRLVRSCLEKDPDRRWQSAHDVAIQLAALSADPAAPSVHPPAAVQSLPWLGWAAAIVATLVAVWALIPRPQPDAAVADRMEFEVAPPTNSRFIADVEAVRFALSPDGRMLAFIVYDAAAPPRVFMRTLSSTESTAVPGSEGAVSVFWSPDSKAIAFVAGETLKRLDLSTGAAVAICNVPRGIGVTGTWGRDGAILFATVEGEGIYRVPAGGGTAIAERRPDVAQHEVRIAYPFFLPDGKRYLFLTKYADGGTALQIGEAGGPSRKIAPIESNAQFVEPATLVFARGGALVAQPFDEVTGRLSGEPVAIAKSVRFFLATGLADFTVSASGTLVYQSHVDQAHVAWVDRGGRELGTIGSKGQYYTVRISPQQQSALVSRTLPSTGSLDIWSLDFARGTETRLTLDDRLIEVAGRLTSDEQAMFYGMTRGVAPNVARMDLRTGRSEFLLPATNHLQEIEDISPDGRWLTYSERTDGGFSNLWTLPLDESTGPVLLHRSQFDQEGFRFAPDSHHYSYVSNESGRGEVYVSGMDGGSKIGISANGGSKARWSADGRELYYVSSDRRLMSVPIRAGKTLEVGTPVTLFAMASMAWQDFDVSRDGQRFLALIPETTSSMQPLTAVQHWNAKR